MEDIDLRGRLIHIPRPKGGEEKAFDIPLSLPVIRCKIRAYRRGRIIYSEPAKSWLFSADSEPGYLVKHKEERKFFPPLAPKLRFARWPGVTPRN
jgi:hypothetical protein